jgi:glutaredoxin 3
MAKVEMYYSEWCGFCHRARALLDAKGVEWTGIDADMTAGARREMVARGGGRTVPQIFIDGTPIGGCQELYMLDGDGRLDALLGLADPAEGAASVPPSEGDDGSRR